ncbi:hypothetical protein [Streptomyces sp. ICBB 8177]|uniref:hypothetical protein n=1 Tax=Streptomyces sp. ICBB 8177 TaxID=563922 RepID=UPI000D6785B3|nr:hypothetical protein [Streptomyces sp. ICBB 8177]PWI43632.1 hypothetical protein CK485_16055 [Streptomyces sp. ICBB 8177]
MPLSFLTSDAGQDERFATADVASRRAVEGWHRPYQLGPWRVATASLLLVLASYLLLAALVEGLAASGPGAVTLLVAGVVVIAVALRLLRVGVWVGAHGLRVTTLLRTNTVSWDGVEVRTAQQPVRLLALPRTVQGQALVIRKAHGGELPTVLTDHSPDFLGRTESFDVAADAIEGWATDLRRG